MIVVFSHGGKTNVHGRFGRSVRHWNSVDDDRHVRNDVYHQSSQECVGDRGTFDFVDRCVLLDAENISISHLS